MRSKPSLLGVTELTDKQKARLWDKYQLLSRLQDKLQNMPVDTDRQLMVYLKYAAEFGKMQGFYTPEVAVTNNSNVLVVTSEQSKELWTEKVKAQQKELHRNSPVSSNVSS